MNAIYLSICLFATSFSLQIIASDEIQVHAWEKEALEEVKKYSNKNPEKEFLLYMIAGRELSSYGLKDKSIHYYQLAFKHPFKGDKTEAVVQLVNLQRDNKARLGEALNRADRWFKENPKKFSPELRQWLTMMKGHASGKTPYHVQGYNRIWATDARITELMKEGKAREAYEILGPQDLTESDINQKVRKDLLSAASLGKESTPPLSCLSTLKEYPTSYTWSMRICRYLDDWKNGKKSQESIESIKVQLQKENPERLYWVKILEKL